MRHAYDACVMRVCGAAFLGKTESHNNVYTQIGTFTPSHVTVGALDREYHEGKHANRDVYTKRIM